MHHFNPAHMRNDPSRVLVDRLIDIEARRIRDRLEARGMTEPMAKAFEGRATELLSQAPNREPQFMRHDIAELADRTSRTALSGSRRDDIRSTVERGLAASACLVHDRSKPIEPENPFADDPAPAIAIDNEDDGMEVRLA